MNGMDVNINRVLFNQKKDAIRWAQQYNYETRNKIDHIPDGASYYEVNTNNQFIGNRKTKNATSTAQSSAPLFIISNDNIRPNSIVDDLEPTKNSGGRKSRRNRRKSRKTRRKSRKTRR
jgi:hypothetical protein